jgi:hypothetical protein
VFVHIYLYKRTIMYVWGWNGKGFVSCLGDMLDGWMERDEYCMGQIEEGRKGKGMAVGCGGSREWLFVRALSCLYVSVLSPHSNSFSLHALCSNPFSLNKLMLFRSRLI